MIHWFKDIFTLLFRRQNVVDIVGGTNFIEFAVDVAVALKVLYFFT